MKTSAPSWLRASLIVFACMLVVAVALLLLPTQRPPAPSAPQTAPAPAAETPAVASTPSDARLANEKTPAATKTAPPAGVVPPDPALLAQLKSFLGKLRAGMPPDEVRQALAALKKQVHDLPPETAASTLLALLNTNEDAATGLAFVVGSEGVMSESPTYRVALLDLLGQTDPEASLSYSRALLSETKLPDEYAVALRNLAWLDHEGDLRPEIATLFSSMLNRDDWRAAPSNGFLEAFDVAVAVGGPAMIGELVSVLRLTTSGDAQASSAINRAAFMALDRLMLREPETLASLIAVDPQFLDFAPNHRASLLARLDPAAPAQEATLRTYLSSLPADSAELAYFAKLFPNGNFFEGNRLVTSWETASSKTTAAQRDQAAIAFANKLLADPTFTPVTPALTKIRDRLNAFYPDAPPALPIAR